MPKLNYDEILKKQREKLNELSQSQPTQPTPPQVSQLESAIRGGAQGVSLGFADEATARLESLTKGIPYEQALEETRAKYRQAQEANPVTYTGSEIAGGILPGLIPTGATQATAGANLARLAAIGAGTGALSGLGFSEGKTAGEIAKDIGIGGALGGALPLGFTGIKKLIPKKIQDSITKEASETISKKTSENVNINNLQQVAKKTETPLKELEESLVNAKSAVEENLGVKISQADELISVLTGKKESLINYLRNNPEKSKQIAEIANTTQKSDDLAKILTEYATANPARKQGIEASVKGKKILQDSKINIPNDEIFNILDKSRKRIIDKNKLGISTPLNLAQKEIEDISLKIIEQPSYDGIALRNLLSNLDDQVNKYGGYYDINQKNKAVQNELKKIRNELNSYIKNQLPEDIRGEYSKQYELASQKLNQAENIESMLTSKKASMRAKGTNIGDLEKANTLLNRYISRPTAGKESEIEYLTKILKQEKPSLNLKDELDKIRIAKQIESVGNQGSNIVNTFRGLASIDLPIDFPGSKLITKPIEKLFEPEAAYIGKRLETKGGKIAQEWADYSRELINQGKTVTQADAYKFILAQSSKEMQPGFKKLLIQKIGAKLPEEKINLPTPEQPTINRMNLPSPMIEKLPEEITKKTQTFDMPNILSQGRNFTGIQSGIRGSLLDEFLNQNRREVERNEFLKQNQNRVK